MPNISGQEFVSSYELRIFSQFILEGKLERWIPGFCDRIIDVEHTQRYDLAKKYVAQKSVLDAACGVGKGSWILAEEGGAAEVIGGDIDEQTVSYARHKYGSPKIYFKTLDLLDLNETNRYDVVVSFETIEHVKHVDTYLRNISGALKQDGLFIVSTPISIQDHDKSPSNPYHVQEWGFASFQNLIRTQFAIEKIFVQRNADLGFFKSLKIAAANKVKAYLDIRNTYNYLNPVLSEILNTGKAFRSKKLNTGYQIVIARKK